MPLTLPPGPNAAGLDRALAAFAGVVGRDWVLADESDRTTYSDLSPPARSPRSPQPAG